MGLCGTAPDPSLRFAHNSPAVAWGDRGNGTVANPVLPADFSDIGAIRVGIATRSPKA